jgi:hypothetical protein
LWPVEAARAAISRAHELGCRVTAHVFGEQALAELVDAGIDGIEHGTGLTDETIRLMAERQVALVPTLLQLGQLREVRPGRLRPSSRVRRHLRALYAGRIERFGQAREAGGPDLRRPPTPAATCRTVWSGRRSPRWPQFSSTRVRAGRRLLAGPAWLGRPTGSSKVPRPTWSRSIGTREMIWTVLRPPAVVPAPRSPDLKENSRGSHSRRGHSTDFPRENAAHPPAGVRSREFTRRDRAD